MLGYCRNSFRYRPTHPIRIENGEILSLLSPPQECSDLECWSERGVVVPERGAPGSPWQHNESQLQGNIRG
jgi:hypothetical protein